MFKLPTCPYCNTVYRYGDTKKSLKEKNHKCYHCNKNFKISKNGMFALFIMMAVISFIINIIELKIFININFLVMAATNVVIILVFLFFVPYFIKYKKVENTDKR